MPDPNLESDVRQLYRDVSDIKILLRNNERAVAELRREVVGDDGKGGKMEAILSQQRITSDNLRLAVWYPTVTSTLAIIIAVAALIIALSQ